MRRIDDNPRAVHQQIVKAFLQGRPMRIGSRYWTDGNVLRVWGNVVASRSPQGITLRDAGYGTLLTKNVLNELLGQIGIPGGYIRQVKRVWMLGGRPWPGEVLVPAKYASLMTMSGVQNNRRRPGRNFSGRQATKRNPLIKGEDLTASQRSQVLNAFGYRWTKENLQRAKQWFSVGGHSFPRIAPVSDARWLKDHAFWFREDGRLSFKRRHAEPVFVADDPHYSKRHNPNPTEYRTVNTSTAKGLEIAEKLHREGWSMGRVGIFTTQFYRRKCQKCGGWMETQGKWGGVERFVCDKCGDEQRRRCETNPLTRRESASLLRDARWRAGLSGSFSKGEASGMARTVKRYGPASARRTAHKVVAVAHGWDPKEVKYDPSEGALDTVWTNPRRNPCGTRHNTSKKIFQLVSVPPHFTTHCYGCKRRVRTVEEPLYADLKGPAFKAYYCSECAHVKKPGVQGNPACGICRGPLVLLGSLGNLVWYRCRNCGMEQSKKKRGRSGKK